jgi:hypothetical protein
MGISLQDITCAGWEKTTGDVVCIVVGKSKLWRELFLRIGKEARIMETHSAFVAQAFEWVVPIKPMTEHRWINEWGDIALGSIPGEQFSRNVCLAALLVSRVFA